MKKVFWSPEEQNAVYAAMVELLVANPLMHKTDLFRAAQSVLPEHRRRKVHYPVVYKYKDLIDRAKKEAKSRPKTPTQEPTPAAAPTQPPTDLLRAILDQFLDVLADKVAERLRQHATPVATQPVVHHKHDPSPISAPRQSKLGVLVIGLLNQQAQTIIQSFPNMEFTCLTPEQALSRETLRRSHTVLMTKFINHSVQNKYRKVENLHLCNGGVSDLTMILKSIS